MKLVITKLSSYDTIQVSYEGFKVEPSLFKKKYPWILIKRNKKPAKDFCYGDLNGVLSDSPVCAVVDGSLDLAARAASFFI